MCKMYASIMRQNGKNLPQPSQMELPKNLRNFLLLFWSLAQLLKILKKKKNIDSHVLPKLGIAKDVVRDESQSFRQTIQVQLSKKQKTFMNFLLDFTNSHKILKILKRKMTYIAHAFPKLLSAKDLVR